MAKVMLHLPPSKAVYNLKGASFVHSADSKGTHIQLDSDPTKRRSQTLLLAKAIEAFGPVKTLDSLPCFHREGKAVKVEILPTHVSHDECGQPKPSFWTHSPAMLRAYLAVINLSHVGHPLDVQDGAHLLWIIREKGGIVPFAWHPANGSKPPAPADASDLTTVFAGAKVVMYGDFRIG